MPNLAIFAGVAMKPSGGFLTPAPGATIEVRRIDTGAIAAIKSDEAGTTPIVNPSAFADSNGRFLFYAAGLERGYSVKVTDGAFTYTIPNIAVGSGAQFDATTYGGQLMGALSAAVARALLRPATVARSSDIQLVTADIATPFVGTGSYTQSFAAAAALSSGWWCYYRNDGAGAITLDPDGAELIDGVASVVLGPSESCLIFSDGAALKTYGRFALPTSAVITTRQTVRLSAVDVNGFASAISAGAGLNFNVDASPSAMVIDFASGSADFTATLTADASNQGALAANSQNFLHATFVNSSSVTWGSCLVVPQYGQAFNKAAQSLLHFEGNDGATSMTDDFGNPWSFNGNAQLDTAQFKFGATAGLLDGTGDYFSSTAFNTLYPTGNDGFTIEGWVRFAVLPGSGNTAILFSSSIGTTNNTGVELGINNTGGTYSVQLTCLSSNGSTADIANGNNSNITTPVVNTWYHWALVYDPISGHYRTYWDGVAEHAISSALRIHASTAWKLGMRPDGSTLPLNGWLDEFRFTPACLYPAGTTFTPSAAGFTVASAPIHWFSIPEMKMYEASSASVSAGTNPGMTQSNRVFVGECDTNGSAVTASRSYALCGTAVIPDFTTPTAGTRTNKTHNLGVPTSLQDLCFRVRCIANNGAYVPGEVIEPMQYHAGGSISTSKPIFAKDRNNASVNCTTAFLMHLADGSSTFESPAAGKWVASIVARRGF